ncbi:MAG: hypothetical protein QME57_03665, partial [Patescibacteria group bacterium]|nr:hypothetical protein [Patescibacteria group bacterium]
MKYSTKNKIFKSLPPQSIIPEHFFTCLEIKKFSLAISRFILTLVYLTLPFVFGFLPRIRVWY